MMVVFLSIISYIGFAVWLFSLLTQIVALIWGKYYLYRWKGQKTSTSSKSTSTPSKSTSTSTKSTPYGVSIIRTIVPHPSSNPKALINLESLFKLAYANFEILICLSQDEPEFVSQIKNIMSKYSHVNAKLFTSPCNEGVNPKINNMLQCYGQIKNDYVWICDSNIFVNEWSLSEISSFLNPDVGMVHQLPFIKSGDDTFIHCLETTYFGTQHARWYLFFNFLGVCCTNGMSSVMTKKHLDDVGGLKAFSCYIAEDHFMGQSCHDRNLKIVLSTEPALQNRDPPSVTDFFNRVLRWQRLRISMVPTSALEPMVECFSVGLIGAFSVSYLFRICFPLIYIFHLSFWFICDQLLLCIIQGNVPIVHSLWQSTLAWLLREVATYWIFLKAIASRKVQWRSGTFDVSYGGKANFTKEDEKFA